MHDFNCAVLVLKFDLNLGSVLFLLQLLDSLWGVLFFVQEGEVTGTAPVGLAGVQPHACSVTESSGWMHTDMKNWCQASWVKVSLQCTMPAFSFIWFCRMVSCLPYRTIQRQATKGNQFRLNCTCPQTSALYLLFTLLFPYPSHCLHIERQSCPFGPDVFYISPWKHDIGLAVYRNVQTWTDCTMLTWLTVNVTTFLVQHSLNPLGQAVL